MMNDRITDKIQWIVGVTFEDSTSYKIIDMSGRETVITGGYLSKYLSQFSTFIPAEKKWLLETSNFIYSAIKAKSGIKYGIL